MNIFFLKNPINLLLGLSIVLCTNGCDSPKSIGEIKTEEVHLSAIVVAEDSSKVHVQASLGDGKTFGGEDYTLNHGDSLVACVASTCSEMKRSYTDLFLPFGAIYTTDLAYQSGNEYVISLYRGSYLDAPNSVVILPDSFEILAPEQGANYTDGESISVNWFPIGIVEDIRSESELRCLLEDGSESFHSGDLDTDSDRDGVVEVTIEDHLYITKALEDYDPVSCDITIKVSHSRWGDIDPAFKDGFIHGQTERTVQVTYTRQ